MKRKKFLDEISAWAKNYRNLALAGSGLERRKKEHVEVTILEDSK
ncbi:MAG: hypothetical protein ACK5NT_08040 [Pyrinomonadaceae bacterium]